MRHIVMSGFALAIATLALVALHPAGTTGVSPEPVDVGSEIAFVITGGDAPGLYLVSPDGSNLRRIVPGVEIGDPRWSPDGSMIAYLNGGWELKILKLSDMSTQSVFDCVARGSGHSYGHHFSSDMSWSADSSKIAVNLCTGELVIYTVSTNTAITVSTNPLDQFPSWHPSLDKFAYACEGLYLDDICTMAGDGSGSAILIDRIAVVGPPRWSPDGNRMAVPSYSGFADALRVYDLATGDVRTVWYDFPYSIFGSFPQWSADGARLGFAGSWGSGGFSTQIVEEPSGTRTSYPTGRPLHQPWSPSGSRLVAECPDDCGGSAPGGIYVQNADGSGQTRIVDTPGDEWGAAWGPTVSPPGPPTPTPTATHTPTVTLRGRYVALGDSIPYGHGLSNPTTKRRDGLPASQGPSRQAYPSLIAETFGFNATIRSTGCLLEGDNLAVSGASSSRFTTESRDIDCEKKRPHKAVDPEELGAARLSSRPAELITIQVGANDIEFDLCIRKLLGDPRVALAEGCLRGGVQEPTLSSDVERELRELKESLISIIAQIRINNPTAKVALINYYQVAPLAAEARSDGSEVCRALMRKGIDERREIREDALFLQRKLNEAIERAANAMSAELIDVSFAFGGREMCTEQSEIYTDSWRAAHPTAAGHERLAAIISRELEAILTD